MKTIQYNDTFPDFLRPYQKTAEMQRISRIDMNCGMNYTSVPLFQDIESYTRYEHSVGVALIVWHFTKDRVQTLSGLFHDISTPAFSHVIDFLNGDAIKQESTEEKTAAILANSHEIMTLLKKDGIQLDEVSDYHKYPIADNDSPMLSSDRLEYTLSASMDYHFAEAEDLQPLYDDIIVGQNERQETELVFQHLKHAVQFCSYALQNGSVFTSQADRYCMELLAELLKQASDKKIISEKDLYTDEESVIRKLLNSPLQQAWLEYRRISRIISSSQAQEGWIQIAAKKRYIDPYCLETQCRVSQADTKMKTEIDQFLNEDFKDWMKGI